MRREVAGVPKEFVPLTHAGGSLAEQDVPGSSIRLGEYQGRRRFTLIFLTKKRRGRRWAAALLAAVLLLWSAVGGQSEEYDWRASEELRSQLYHLSLDTENEIDLSNSEETDMVMAYTADDTFNPYTCQSTLTQNICHLIYDNLIDLNPNFEPEYIVAKNVTVDHTIIHVQVRSGLVFSNGAPLTAEDVSYSYYTAAKTKGSIYAERLKDVISCSMEGMTVTFVMQNENVNAYRLLDFPIIHFDPSANKDFPPIGSGRYKFATFSDGVTPNTSLLVKNQKWYHPDKVQIETIGLKEMPSVESIVHSIEIGTLSYLYSDLRDGEPKNVNANYKKVDLNNLVYLGVNTNDTVLADENVRRAIHYAISTDRVATAAFSGMALGATGPFTPHWSEAAKYQTGNGRAYVNRAIELLRESGYVTTDAQGIRQDQGGVTLSFNMLVGRGNAAHLAAAESIKSQLAEVGINVNIVEISTQGLVQRASEGKYHLYLAEYSVLNDMDISKLFTPGEGLYNGPKPYDSVRTFNNYRLGMGTLEDFITAFDGELPFIPVCYRMGIVVYSRSLEGVGELSENQPFYHMQDWRINKN